MPEKPICKIPGCGKPVRYKRMCRLHYGRWVRTGDPGPLLPKKIQTPRGAPMAFVEKLIASDWPDECVRWPFNCYPDGRGQVYFRGKVRPAARVVCILAHGEPPGPDMHAAHDCGKGHEACVNPGHLEWKTRSGNAQDTIRHGTSRRGDHGGAKKLDEATVRAIRSRLASGESGSSIARRYGIHRATVSDIKLRRLWAWVD